MGHVSIDTSVPRARASAASRNPAPAADVDDVKAGPGFLREEERTLDGFELGDDRPRVEEGPRGSRRDAFSETARQLLALCVHGDRQPETRRFTQPIEQRDIVHAGKFGKARVAHERLESDDAARGHLGHVGHRAGHESTPQREVGDG